MKIALITGGSRGIGAATVQKFAENGYTVILNYHNSEAKAFALRDSLRARGLDVHAYGCDVANVSEIAEMFAWVKKYFKRLDVLVNNAGICIPNHIQAVDEAQFDATMNVNCKGAFFACKHAVEMFTPLGGGAIVNVSSIWGLEGAACESVYSMSKFAVVGLTQSLACELENSGVTVNCVCPPIVLTDMNKHLSREEAEEFSRLHRTPILTAGQVAEVVFRLATDGSDGQIVNFVED